MVAANLQSVHFDGVNVTLTELHRETRRALKPVQQGQPVRVTDRGAPVAIMQPDYPAVRLTVEEFRALDMTPEQWRECVNESVNARRERLS